MWFVLAYILISIGAGTALVDKWGKTDIIASYLLAPFWPILVIVALFRKIGF